MFQRNVPDRECLEFCVAGPDSAFVLMIELGKAGRHFSASRSRGSDDYQRSGCLNIIISSISLIAHDQRNIGRISFNNIMSVDTDSHVFKTVAEEIRALLAAVLRDDNAADIETVFFKGAFQAEYIIIVGDTKISADLVFFNVTGTDDDDDLSRIGKLF